jgi:hypothetical protein
MTKPVATVTVPCLGSRLGFVIMAVDVDEAYSRNWTIVCRGKCGHQMGSKDADAARSASCHVTLVHGMLLNRRPKGHANLRYSVVT